MSQNNDEVLVRVEGVSKKFCRSLKKSLWYGVCDIASELNPFGRNAGQSSEYNHLTTEGTESTERAAGGNQQADSGEFLEGHSHAGLQMDSEKLAAIRSANNPSSSEKNSSSAEIGEICGKQSDTPTGEASLRPGEFFAVKDVSFELRCGECLGLIGHNGAGKTTLLKMLNGLIKPDAGSIMMRGRVGALIALGAGFNPSREPKGWEACRTSNQRLARRVQRRREGANQNIYINGSVLGLTKKDRKSCGYLVACHG